jgi:hypothetical protein
MHSSKVCQTTWPDLLVSGLGDFKTKKKMQKIVDDRATIFEKHNSYHDK